MAWSDPKSRQEPTAIGRWTVPFALALLAQLPLLALIVYVIERSVSDVDFKPVGLNPEMVLEPDRQDPDADAPTVPRIVDETPEPKTEPLPDEIDGTEKPAGQIVEVAPPDDEEMPDKARYAARYAMKVAQETRARQPSRDQELPQRFADEKRKETRPAPARSGQTSPAPSPDLSMPGQKASDDGERPALEGQPSGPDGLPEGPPDGLALRPALEGVDPARKYSPSAAPFASDDYIGDVNEEGDTNLLNTIPYRYVGFFERVKRNVRHHWDPNRVYRLRDPSGDIYGHRDRFTMLSVVLDSRGYVLDTSIVGESGLQFLDDEAVRSFWAAGPFLNPPKALVGTDGKIRFDFTFGFLVASSRRTFNWSF